MEDPNKKMDLKRFLTLTIIISVLVSLVIGVTSGFIAGTLSSSNTGSMLAQDLFGKKKVDTLKPQTSTTKVIDNEESQVIEVVEKSTPAVVSIIISKDVPKYERFFVNPFNENGNDPFSDFFGDFFRVPVERETGTEKVKVGAGSGFIVSEDGMIVTNKHVVADESAEYTVILSDEKKFDAKVLARDPVLDLAILKIESNEKLTYLPLGDSENVKIGQRVIAIGFALGQFSNTVSTGVISGKQREITAGGGMGSQPETLSNLLQTDAAINEGNSGGPLLNLSGEVIGINTALAAYSQNVGFAIPINQVRTDIESIEKDGEITRPFLGIRYVLIDEEIAKKNNLDINHGALVARGADNTEPAVIPNSPADKAGIEENDIILEVDGKEINEKNNLNNIIQMKRVGDRISMKILRKGNEKTLEVTLEKRK